MRVVSSFQDRVHFVIARWFRRIRSRTRGSRGQKDAPNCRRVDWGMELGSGTEKQALIKDSEGHGLDPPSKDILFITFWSLILYAEYFFVGIFTFPQ